jgi:hypothetical protein
VKFGVERGVKLPQKLHYLVSVGISESGMAAVRENDLENDLENDSATEKNKVSSEESLRHKRGHSEVDDEDPHEDHAVSFFFINFKFYFITSQNLYEVNMIFFKFISRTMLRCSSNNLANNTSNQELTAVSPTILQIQKSKGKFLSMAQIVYCEDTWKLSIGKTYV